MGQEPRTDRTPVNETRDPQELREDIEETRRELGDTVAALSAKTDVKAQVRDKLDDVKASAAASRDELADRARDISPESVRVAAASGAETVRRNPLPVAVAGAFAGGFLLGRLTGRGS